MVVHLVLFRPKPGVTGPQRAAMFESLAEAAQAIPTVRRFQIGSRVRHGAGYEALMTEDYAFAASVEFDDLAGLQAYLVHPVHQRLGQLFYELSTGSLAYDYEMTAL